MRESSSLNDKMIDRNWVLKRKRKHVSNGLESSKERESISLGSDSPGNKHCIKKKPRGDAEIARFGHRLKGHDGVISLIS